jgi:hypothetical protein
MSRRLEFRESKAWPTLVRSMSMNNWFGWPWRAMKRFAPISELPTWSSPASAVYVMLDEREDSINDDVFASIWRASQPAEANHNRDYPASYHNGAEAFLRRWSCRNKR